MTHSPKFKYKFDKKSGVLFKYYYGSITINDIIFSWEYAIANNLIPKEVIGYLLDYREASFDIKPSDLKEIPAYYKGHPNLFRNCKIAILTENPKDIVVPLLVKEADDGYQSEPFSTKEAAIAWILN